MCSSWSSRSITYGIQPRPASPITNFTRGRFSSVPEKIMPGERLVELHRHDRDERRLAPGIERRLDAVQAAREVHVDRQAGLLRRVPERGPRVLEERRAAADRVAHDRALVAELRAAQQLVLRDERVVGREVGQQDQPVRIGASGTPRPSRCRPSTPARAARGRSCAAACRSGRRRPCASTPSRSRSSSRVCGWPGRKPWSCAAR